MQIMELLLMRLSRKGVFPDEVPRLIKDVLTAVGDSNKASLCMLNRRLAVLGWGEEILDQTTLGLILFVAEKPDERRLEPHL